MTNKYKSALQEIHRTGERLDDSVVMMELVTQGLVTYKSHYGPPVLTGIGRAIVEVDDSYGYYYYHPHNGMIPLIVVEVHDNKQWVVKNCDDCGAWSCHVDNIYMQPRKRRKHED